MLSRIAESLYWIGRYTERAEDTARLLDVHSHALLEDRRRRRGGGVPRAARRDGCAEPGRGRRGRHRTSSRSSAFFVDDPRFAGSIVCSLEAAWENARGAREAMSSEMWESINTTYRELDVRARPVGVPRSTGSSAGCATAPRRVAGSPTRR